MQITKSAAFRHSTGAGGNPLCPDTTDFVDYTFTIENTGVVTLTNVSLIDNRLSLTPIGIDATFSATIINDTNSDFILEVGERWEFVLPYSLTQDDIDGIIVSNTASATAEDPVSDPVNSNIVTEDLDLRTAPSVSANCIDGSIDLVKSADFRHSVGVGGNPTCPDDTDFLDYTFSITNVGSVTLDNLSLIDIRLSNTAILLDATLTTNFAGSSINESMIADLKLGVGETWTVVVPYNLTQTDIDGITVSNTAKVDAQNTLGNAVSSNDSIVVYNLATDPGALTDPDCFTGRIDLIKSALLVQSTDPSGDPLCPDATDTINFTFEFENVGSISLFDVFINDTMLTTSPIAVNASLSSDSTLSGDTNSDYILGVGEIWTVTVPYALTQADIDARIVSNTASVGAEDSAMAPVISNDSTAILDFNALFPGCLDANISITKTGVFEDRVDADGCQDVDDVIVYTFVIENEGLVTLTDIRLTDVLLAGLPVPVTNKLVTTSLAPGAIETVTEEYALVAADISNGSVTNSATVTALDPDGVTSISQISLDAIGNVDTIVILPCLLDLSIDKDVNELKPTVDDEVVFTLTVENIGGVLATDIVVIDNIPAAFDLIGIEGTPSAGTTNLTTDSVEWTIPSLDFGETAVLNIRVEVNPDSEADADGYTNTATITDSLGVTHVDDDFTNDEDDITLEPNCLRVYSLVSPNNDGDNESLHIDCIGDYPGNSIRIYNRWGSLIYETQDYDNVLNNWSGQSNSDSIITIDLGKNSDGVPEGTYYYILDLNNGEEPLAGWIYSKTPQSI
jgi:gliding motility-associated-like protein/uncharacterized repeat protein (TIGR01451 family)